MAAPLAGGAELKSQAIAKFPLLPLQFLSMAVTTAPLWRDKAGEARSQITD
jgi:hypothetical protein